MKRLIAVIAGLAALLLIAALAAPFFISANIYRAKLVELIEARTGRQVAIDGSAGFNLFPNIGIQAENVRFANAAWGSEPDMARMKELHVSLKLLPLLSGNVQIDEFTLTDPVIRLEVRADGTPNWAFFPEAKKASPTAQQSAPAKAEAERQLNELGLTALKISNGSVSYRNAQTGELFTVEHTNLDLAMPGLDEPLTAQGSLDWKGETLALTLDADRPRAFLSAGETQMALGVKSKRINLSFTGKATPRENFGFSGDVSLDAPSLRDLTVWVGANLPPANGFGPLTLKGRIRGEGSRLAFTDATLKLDRTNAKGDITLDTSGARALITGRLALDALDLDNYAETAPAPHRIQPKPIPPSEIYPPITPGTGAAGKWSTEPFAFDGLKSINADLTLSSGALVWQKMQIGQTDFRLRIMDGILAADLQKLALYKGTGTGSLRLDATSATPSLSTSFRIKDVDTKSLLTAAAGFDRLSGIGALNFTLSANGKNQLEMIRTLNGKADLHISNGAIKGVNVASLVRGVFNIVRTAQKGGEISGWNGGGNENTDFSELGASFNIMRGMATNDDLTFSSPLVRVSGAGKIDILHRQLDYRVVPTAVPSLKGQGGESDLKGITVPLFVEGPWEKPAFRPDVKSLLLNSRETVETIRSLKNGGAENILKELLVPPAKKDAGKQTTPASPKDFLNNLLKR